LRCERLEDRTLPAGHALASATFLPFTPFQTAEASGFLAQPNEVDLYEVSLQAGDRLQAGVSAASAGSGLQSVLRIFDAAGRPVALDDQEGGDPSLSFQAATAGNYFVGVSSAGNDAYNPGVVDSGSAGTTTGLYVLNLELTPGAPLLADLAGASFRLGTDTAAWGEAVPLSFSVENRGGAAAGPFDVQVLVSASNTFNPSSSLVVRDFALAGLGAGGAFSPGGAAVTLPDAASAAAAGLAASGPLDLGLRIVPADPSQDAGVFDKSGVHRGADWEELTAVSPVVASGHNHAQASADVLPSLNSRASGVLGPGQVDWYALNVTEAGRLSVQVTPGAGSSLGPRVQLVGPDGSVLTQADGTAVLAQHVLAGTFFLAVSAEAGTGAYRLVSTFTPTDPLLQALPVGASPKSVTAADVNGDGRLDLIVANSTAGDVSVLLGSGDGSFRAQRTFATAPAPFAVVVADINGDGHPDLITANHNTVSVLLGNGDGSFQKAQSFALGGYVTALAVADVNGDGKPDLIVANSASNTVSVLLNTTAPGSTSLSFAAPQPFAVGLSPHALVVADVNGDGKPDLIVTNKRDNTVSVLLNTAPGSTSLSFAAQVPVAAGSGLASVAVADVNGDGHPDLVVADESIGNSRGGVSVLRGNGDGSFQPLQTFATGSYGSVAVADVNSDGSLDLIATNSISGGVSVLLGNGQGSFQQPRIIPTSRFVQSVAVADVNGDGHLDLILPDRLAGDLSVLLGNGDGSFLQQPVFATGAGPRSVAVADVNGDGKPDLIVVNGIVRNEVQGSVSVLLGNGDGTFGPQRTFATGSDPDQVTVADVNGDGRPDLIVGNLFDTRLSVLLGNGDGTFGPPRFTPALPSSGGIVSVADVNGDGIPDLIVANPTAGDVSVLLGKGDGTFQPPRSIPAGTSSFSPLEGQVAVADVNGDGKPDLITTNYTGGTVSVLPGNGDGTFQPQQTFDVGPYPGVVAVADVNGDGKPDLIVTNKQDNTVSVLLNTTVPGATSFSFAAQQPVAAGLGPYALAVADVNGDGILDLVVTDGNRTTTPGTRVSVLLGDGKGSFQPARTFAPGGSFNAVAVADVNGDGKPDIVFTHETGDTASVLLGNGDGSFTAVSAANGVEVRDTPYLADLDGDGTLDAVILDGAGDILFRHGLPGTNDSFAPPVILNPGRPAQDLVLLRTGAGWAIAAADARPDPDLSSPTHSVYTVSLYVLTPNDSVSRTTALVSSLLPTRLAVGALIGSGRDDLVVAHGKDNSVSIAFQVAPGQFSSPLVRRAGLTPADLALVDVNGDGLLDIVVSNQASGDVSVFLNDASHSFTTTERFGAALAPSETDTTSGSPVVKSFALSVSLAAGDFTGSGRADLVVVNRGAHSFSVLANDGQGGFANPTAALTTPTNDGTTINEQPGPVVAGDFNRDGKLDLAILVEDTAEVWVYRGNGDGTFTHPTNFVCKVGTQATELSVIVDPQTGFLDLLVGNSFGNMQQLLGNGDGTFQLSEPRPEGSAKEALAVVDFGNGSEGFLFGNGQAGHVVLQYPDGTRTLLAATTAGALLTPTAVTVTDLNGDHIPDFLVVNSTGDEILVFRGLAANAAGELELAPPAAYPVGIDPIAVTVADLNGDGIPDLLVANAGSNDVSVLFGALDAAGNWVATPGPRIRSGGSGPVAVSLFDANGDGIPDLVLTNGQSGTVTLLPGRGLGFFDDRTPRTLLTVPGNPDITQTVIDDFNRDGLPDLLTVNSGTDTLTFLSDFLDPHAAPQQITSGGTEPVDVLVGDFNQDGLPDLLVANEGGTGQGNVTLLLNSLSGFRLAEVLADPSVPHPTALVATPSFGQVYAATAGQDVAFPVRLQYDDYPNIPEQAQPLPDLTSNPLVVQGDINYTGDSDFFKFVASQTGTVLVRESDQVGGADSLVAFDASGETIGSDTAPGVLTLEVVADNTYLLGLTGHESTSSAIPYEFDLSYEAPVLLVTDSDFGGGPESGGERPQTAELLPLNNLTVPLVATLVTGTEEASPTLLPLEEVPALPANAPLPGLAPGGENGGPVAGVFPPLTVLLALLNSADEDSAQASAEHPASGPDDNAALNKLLLGIRSASEDSAPLTREGLLGPPSNSDSAGESILGSLLAPASLPVLGGVARTTGLPLGVGWVAASVTVALDGPIRDALLSAQEVFGAWLRPWLGPGRDPTRPPLGTDVDVLPTVPEQPVPAGEGSPGDPTRPTGTSQRPGEVGADRVGRPGETERSAAVVVSDTLFSTLPGWPPRWPAPQQDEEPVPGASLLGLPSAALLVVGLARSWETSFSVVNSALGRSRARKMVLSKPTPVA
jgi:hypothetical protein